MNIGSFMKLVGDIQPAANRVLELRPGQTVRATVVEAGPGANEALLQIGDNQLVAKLETPLKAGQTASLQVQGETPEGLLLLKLADKTAKGTGEPELEQWKELAAKLGLPGKDSGAAALLKELRAAGLPLTRETAAAVATAAALKPEGADAAEWLRAAASAIQRGLPVTQETLLALRQAMSGPPVHELLGKLQQELEAWAGSRQAGVVAQPASAAAPGTAGGPAGAGELTLRSSQLEGNVPAANGVASASSGGEVAARLLTLLKEGGGWIAPHTERGNQAGIAGKADPNEAVGAKQISASSLPPSGLTASEAAANEAAPAEPRTELMRGGDKPALSAAASPAGGGAQGTAASVKAFLQWMGTSHEHALLELPAQQPKGAGEPRTGTSQPANHGHAAQPVGDETAANAGSRTVDGQIIRTAARLPVGSPTEPAAETAQRAAAGGSYSGNAADSAAAGKSAGAAASAPQTGTQQAMKADAPGSVRTGDNLTDGESEAAAGKSAPALNERITSSEARAAAAFALPAGALAEGQSEVTLKAALLQLLEQPDVPAAVKEAGNQLMQQITGQQLLLSPERSGIFFSQLSLQLPIKTPDGESTATIQVQTRRGGKGAVDAANCRLLFQLELSSLGTTAIDVHVVDKVVSLTVYGANPVIPQLLEAGRPELNNRLQESGYRLLGLRAVEPKPAVQMEGNQAGESGKSSVPSQWSQDVYRGVDLKV
ncbi:flagellar hook-length control protein FliK [Paenibacillus pasadenensis]|uniref:flagellar hook-length control protein FliK n=1 Tax=Paenibacillus pasadenensis TaxID=217090 RepID=UPI00203E8713|nr:flagellar hook-length control protein FliK [Paenibacillus pasadenensis]MCM3746028.1 flagellar hook-length control protein FliK [Paenibacillus pasadenensis]